MEQRACDELTSCARLPKHVYDAVRPSNTTIIEKWLDEEGGHIDARWGSYDETLLMLAASLGRTPVIRLCLRRGADVNLRSGSGNTALFQACAFFPLCHVEVARLLLEAGARMHPCSDQDEPIHEPVLEWVERCNREYAEEPAERLAEPGHPGPRWAELLKLLQAYDRGTCKLFLDGPGVSERDASMPLFVPLAATFEGVSRRIHDKLGCPPEQQRLRAFDGPLEGTDTVEALLREQVVRTLGTCGSESDCEERIREHGKVGVKLSIGTGLG